MSNNFLNKIVGMYKQAQAAKKAETAKTLDKSLKEDLLNGNKTWEDAGKDIRDSGWSSFSLDKEGTIEMLKLTEEEIAKIDSLQQTAKEKKQIAEEYTKQYYAGKFDLETLHDKLVKIFGDVGTAFEWLRDNDEKIKRSSSTKKQAGIDPNVSTEDILTLNFDMPIEKADKVKEQFNEKGIKYQSRKGKYTVEFSVDIEAGKVDLVYEIIRNIKKSSSTKKQAKKLEFEDDIVEVTDKKGKVIYEGMFDYLDYNMKEDFYDTAKTKWIGNKYKISLPNGEYYLKVKGHKNNKLDKQATIKHENGVYNVYSESGKCLGKGYKTKEEAEKRLKQVEYFKHKNASRKDWEFPGYETEPIDSRIEWLYTHNVNYNNTQYDYIWKLRETLKGEHVDFDEKGEKVYLNKDDIEDILYYLKHHNKNYRGDQYWIIDDLKVEDFIKNLKSNKRTTLKQVVISKMATDLKDIPESVKKNILSDLVYVILTGKGSFAYKTVAKMLETIIKELGYGDKLKANEDGSLPTMEIVELISKEPKVMDFVGKFANITRAF